MVACVGTLMFGVVVQVLKEQRLAKECKRLDKFAGFVVEDGDNDDREREARA